MKEDQYELHMPEEAGDGETRSTYTTAIAGIFILVVLCAIIGIVVYKTATSPEVSDQPTEPTREVQPDASSIVVSETISELDRLESMIQTGQELNDEQKESLLEFLERQYFTDEEESLTLQSHLILQGELEEFFMHTPLTVLFGDYEPERVEQLLRHIELQER